MHIAHVALWTNDLERLKSFYETYFGAHAGEKYVNSRKRFESYFLTFASGARLELMRKPDLIERSDTPLAGYTHLAFSVGSKQQVDELTAQLQATGCRVVDGPRYTGDGYYESSVLDPDGNPIEITI
ncbi:MAG: VOC family protein [Anaerolineae bacterium]